MTFIVLHFVAMKCVCPELLPYSQKITPPTIQYPITYWSYFQFYHCLSFYLYFTDQPKHIIAALTGTIMRQPCSRGKTGWSETVKEERSEPLRESETTSTEVIRRHSATQPLVLHNTLREIPSNFYFLKTKNKWSILWASWNLSEWIFFLGANLDISYKAAAHKHWRHIFHTFAPAQKCFIGCDRAQQGLRNEARKGEQTGGR